MYWIGLLGPVAYISLLVGSLATFSTLNKKRKAAKEASAAPWFGPHVPRNVYLSLLHIEPTPGQKSPVVPESVLKAALLRRAIEDIHRVLALRNAKNALSTLLQRGSVGDDLWQQFQRAEKEIEEEIKDVVNEANAFAPNWGTTIFQTANEMAANALLRKRLDEIQAQAKTESAWWDKKRSNIQSEFMKELNDGSAQGTASAVSGTPQKPVLTSTASSQGQAGSDEDAVLVESGGPAAGGVKGSMKKKRGKK